MTKIRIFSFDANRQFPSYRFEPHYESDRRFLQNFLHEN